MNPSCPRPPQPIRNLVLAALVAAIGLTPGGIGAQTPPAPVAVSSVGATGLSLKEAAQLAVLGNPEVLARWHTIKAALGERDAARGALLPRVDLSLARGRERGDLGNGSTSGNTLSLTQLLYDGFATRNEIERLDHATRVRLYEFFDTSEAVALEAVRAYVDVLRYRELVRLAEDNYVEHRAVFFQTDQRVQARVAPSVDLEQVRGRLALAESNLLTEQANLHDTTARFQRIIGRLPGGALSLPAYLAQDIPADASIALTRVQERHGALLAAIENVRASSSALASRKGAFGPRVDLRLRREQGSSLSTTSANTNANATTAEVLLTWNLFNGFGDLARERQFAEQVNVAKDLRDKVCRDTRQTLVIAYNDVTKLRDQFEFLTLHEGATSRALTAYRLQFSIGQRTLLSLLDTENELFQARRAVANARHDLHFAYARTQAGLGNLLRALELTSLRTDVGLDQLPTPGPGEAAVECQPEPIGVYVSNKQQLIDRAAQLTRPSSSVAPRSAAPMPSAVPVAPASTAVVAAPATLASQPGPKAVSDALEAWRAAWTGRNLASYFSAYAPGISPARGVSRDDWETRRRNVIGSAKAVSLVFDDVVVQLQDATHATAAFKQVYRSASYRDEVSKTLRWERIGNRWLIVEESAAGLR